MRRTPWKGMVLATVAGLVAFPALLSMPVVSDALVDRLQVFSPISEATLSEASVGQVSAIVILAAGRRVYAPEFSGETVDGLSLERLRYGARLARQSGLPVLLSGGTGVASRTSPLAKLMADALLQDYGIDAKWLETQSRNTAENAINSTEILRSEGVSRIVLVTHAWHMPRARAAFIANGMTVIPAPTAFQRPTPTLAFSGAVPSITALQMSIYAIHESIGSVWYTIWYGY